MAEQVTSKIKRYALCYKAKSKAKEDIKMKKRIVLKTKAVPMEVNQETEIRD